MKKITIAILAVALISLGALFIFAQKEYRRGPRGGGFGPGPGLMMMAEELGLSEEQKTQVRGILEDSRTRIQPLAETVRANHRQIKDLGTDGTFNEAEVTRLANAQAETMKQLIIEKERTKASIFAVLTPEQRVRANELKEQMKERFRDRMRGPRGGEFED